MNIKFKLEHCTESNKKEYFSWLSSDKVDISPVFSPREEKKKKFILGQERGIFGEAVSLQLLMPFLIYILAFYSTSEDSIKQNNFTFSHLKTMNLFLFEDIHDCTCLYTYIYEILYYVTVEKFSLKQCLLKPWKKWNKTNKNWSPWNPSHFLGIKLQNSVKRDL